MTKTGGTKCWRSIRVFSGTLISHGKRGGNVWLYIDGDYPKSCDIKTKGEAKIAEFRANGRQTVIRGVHQSGNHYTNNGQTPISARFNEIVWPDDAVLPWADAPSSEAGGGNGAEEIADPLEEQLIAGCGVPFVALKGSGVKINHAYFVRRFCMEHHVVFETTENAFHLYDHETGAWQYVDNGVVKELMRADWLRISTAKGGNILSVMGTDALFNQFVSGIRSASGKANAFGRLGRGFLHVGNHVLEIHVLEIP